MKLLKDAINFLFPAKCATCGNVIGDTPPIVEGLESPVCFSCLKQIIPVEKDRRWFLCLSEPYSEDPYPSLTLYMPFIYYGFFSRAVPVIKFGKNQKLAIFLGLFLASLLVSDGIDADIIIPMPLSEQRLSERGFNQAELIAKESGELLRVPVVTDCLIRSVNTKRQTEIKDKSFRGENVSGAFKVSPNWIVDGLRIILIDDVVTTGFTMHEAACELLNNGAKQVLCVALCGNRAYKNAESY